MAPLVEELLFPHLNIHVTVDSIFTVKPAGPIPACFGDTLYLSNLDDMIGSRVFTPTVYFYRSNESFPDRNSIMRVLREAIAAVLVPYYPFSGRLRERNDGKLEVFFGLEQGVIMVEAHTDTRLAHLGDLSVPNPAWSPLVYKLPAEGHYQVTNMPLVIAQVTFFSCGSFSIGLRTCHCLCDGLGAMQFLNAWSSTAKAGKLVTNPNPCWDREFLRPREPPLVEFPHVEFMRFEDDSNLSKTLRHNKLVQKCYRVNREFQAHLKKFSQTADYNSGFGSITFVFQVHRTSYELSFNIFQAVDDNSGSDCTTFDAMTAHIWRCWVKALDVKPLNSKLRLTFSVNMREKLRNPSLRDGFYGNAVCVACAATTATGLTDGCFADVARMVHEARLGITEDYVRSTIDFMEVFRPKRLEFDGKLTVTQWTRFSIYESANFGWGKPVYAGPIDLKPTPQICMFLPEGEGGSSETTLVCICLPEPVADRFKELMCLIGM